MNKETFLLVIIRIDKRKFNPSRIEGGGGWVGKKVPLPVFSL